MTSIDDMSALITEAVREYTDDVAEGISEEIIETAKLIRNTAVAEAPKDTGEYARGFTVTKPRRGRQGNERRVIWNRRHSRLVHLLEFGHAKRGGGRVPGKPHLRPAYDRHIGRFQENVRRIIKNGGRS